MAETCRSTARIEYRNTVAGSVLFIVSQLTMNEHIGFLNPEVGTDMLSRNFGKKLPLLAA